MILGPSTPAVALRRTSSQRRRSITLIHTPCPELEDDRLEPPLGLLYLATWLKREGHDVCLLDFSSRDFDIEDLPQTDFYGFSTYTATYASTREIVRRIRSVRLGAHMIAGGPHASALPQQVLADFDAVVVGEGEVALQSLLEADDFAAGERIVCGPIIEDLDQLPFPDYSFVDIDSYHRLVGGRPSLSILSSRGCPYGCLFCNSVVLGQSPPRARSAANVAAEILALRDRWGIQSFRFQDDTFTTSLPRVRTISRMIAGQGIVYRCFGRPDHCNREMTDILYAGGCRHISLGVESGCDRQLERMGKKQTRAQIRAGIENARASGLRVRVFLLVGFPGETWASVDETVGLMLECRPDEFVAYPAIPYPGTLLYESPERFGITQIDQDFSKYLQVARERRAGFVFHTADLDPSVLQAMRQSLIERLEPSITWAGHSKEFR